MYDTHVTRRAFFTTGTIAAAAGIAGLPGPAVRAENATNLRKRRLKLSLAAYSFRSHFEDKRMTMEAFMDFCADLNLEGTELTSYWFDAPDPRDPRTVDDAYLRSLKLRCFKQGLDVSGSSIGNNFVKADAAERRREIETVKIWCDKAEVLGAPVIRVFGGSRFPAGATEEDVFSWVIPALQECTAYAATRGVVLALENHGGFPETAEQTIRLLQAVDNPWLGVTLDTGNFHEDWYAQMAELIPFASTVQVKPSIQSSFGQGRIATDPERIMRLLKLGGYKGYVVLEYADEEDPFTAVPRWIECLRRLAD